MDAWDRKNTDSREFSPFIEEANVGIYGLVFNMTGGESDATNIGNEEAAYTGPRDLDGW
jgi:hypothetical protein